jgi:hypothetical protein
MRFDARGCRTFASNSHRSRSCSSSSAGSHRINWSTILISCHASGRQERRGESSHLPLLLHAWLQSSVSGRSRRLLRTTCASTSGANAGYCAIAAGSRRVASRRSGFSRSSISKASCSTIERLFPWQCGSSAGASGVRGAADRSRGAAYGCVRSIRRRRSVASPDRRVASAARDVLGRRRQGAPGARPGRPVPALGGGSLSRAGAGRDGARTSNRKDRPPAGACTLSTAPNRSCGQSAPDDASSIRAGSGARYAARGRTRRG